MSEHSAVTDHPPEIHAAPPDMAPQFDRAEVDEFSKDDGHAVTVIGKMLVGFFFYSLIAMFCVALWTWSANSNSAKPVKPAEHGEHGK